MFGATLAAFAIICAIGSVFLFMYAAMAIRLWLLIPSVILAIFAIILVKIVEDYSNE